MGFLADRRILITGVQPIDRLRRPPACQREGATLVHLRQRRPQGSRGQARIRLRQRAVLPCDVSRDEDIDALFAALGKEWGALDGLLHSIAFAPRESLSGLT